MKEERVIVCAYWRERKITAKEYIRLCHEFLLRLQDFSTAFERRCVAVGQMPNIVPMIVPKNYTEFEQIMMKAVPNSKNLYKNPSSTNKESTLDSTCELGFDIAFTDADDGLVSPTHLAVSITAGAYGGPYSPTNVVLIEIPPKYRAFWENKES